MPEVRESQQGPGEERAGPDQVPPQPETLPPAIPVSPEGATAATSPAPMPAAPTVVPDVRAAAATAPHPAVGTTADDSAALTQPAIGFARGADAEPRRAPSPRPSRARALAGVLVPGLAMTALLAAVVVPIVITQRHRLPARWTVSAEAPGAGAAAPSDAPSAVASAELTAGTAAVTGDGGLADDGVPAGPPTPPPGPPPAPVWRVAMLNADAAVQVREAAVGKRTLVAALGALGIGRGEVHRLVHAFSGVRRFDHLDPKDTVTVARDKKSGRLVAFELATSPVDVWQAREPPSDELSAPGTPPAAALAPGAKGRAAKAEKAPPLSAKKLDLRAERRRVAVAVNVDGDLRTAITHAGLDEELLKLLDDALVGRAELADLRAGVRLRIVASEDRIEGNFARYADLEAVEYFAAVPNAVPVRVYHWAPERAGKNAGFYDAKGRQPLRGGWRSPVPMARISSRFNPRRVHPILRVVMPHNGVDFAAPPGTPVYASGSGVVRSAGGAGPCGNMVELHHLNGLITAYCHLQRFAAGLHGGQHVDARQLIGYVGQTGRATGPHLHFAVRRGNIFIDPLALKLDGMRVLPPRDREAFTHLREELDQALEAIALPPAPTLPDGGEAPPDETINDEPP